jgi:hypothetical protein
MCVLCATLEFVVAAFGIGTAENNNSGQPTPINTADTTRIRDIDRPLRRIRV